MPIYSSSVDAGSSVATVGDLIDRVYRDFLAPVDDQPVVITAAASATHSATSISYDASTLAPDEEDLLAPGVLIEVGREQARITDVDTTAGTLTVIRGVNGTDADDIVSGDEIRVAPLYSRQTVFDAVCDAVVDLYPDLFAVGSTTVTTDSSPVEVTADIISIIEVRRLYGSTVLPVQVELLRNWPPATTTKTALAFHGVPSDVTVYVTYEARFAFPDTEDVVLGDLGIDQSWERILVVDAAAHAIAGRDFDAVSGEYLTEQLEREGFRAGSASTLRDALLQYRSYLMAKAKKQVRANRPVPVVVQQ